MEALDRLLGLFGWKVPALLLFSILLLPPIAIVLTMSLGWEATFSTDAQTEILKFRSADHNVPNWFVAFDRLRVDGRDLTGLEAQVHIARNARVRLQRLETGPLELTIEAEREGPAARLYDRADQPIAEAQERLQGLVTLTASSTLTLPLAGHAAIGETVFSQATGTSPVLIDGGVEVFGLEAFGRNRFAAGRVELDAGDRLQISRDGDTAGGHGLIRVESGRPGMQVVFHADGDKARIVRFGTAGYELSPSLWARISSDPLYQALLALYAALLPVLAVITTTLAGHWRMQQLDRLQHGQRLESSGTDDGQPSLSTEAEDNRTGSDSADSGEGQHP